MSDMSYSPEGPVPAGMVPDPTQVNGGPQPQNGEPVEPPAAPATPGLDELVQGLGLALRAQTLKAQNADQPDGIKASSAACLALAQSIAALAPPMKPIDPALHASTRGVDPQRALEMRHEAELQRLQREHDLTKQAADHRHQLALERAKAAKPGRQMKVKRDGKGAMTGIEES